MNGYFSVLADEALLHLSGPDALKFLQGQATCDTRAVDAQRSAPGACCTPQGRVYCDFLLVQLAPEHYALRLRRDIRADTAARLGKYIVFSKAKLDADRDDWQVAAAWGDAAGAAIATVFGARPAERFAAISGDGYAVVQTDSQGLAFECMLRADSNWGERLAGALAGAAEQDWQRQQIVAGVARVEAATVEEFVPQALNYDLTGHISFNKGCYTGQEVVARLHYRGKSKRRAYVAEVAGAAAAAGASLFTGDGGQSAGEIVNCAGGDPALALVSTTAEAVASGLRLGSPQGPALRLSPPPYPLPVD